MKKVVFILAIGVLMSCSKDEPTPKDPVPVKLTGVFKDSPVEGIKYTSGSLSGITDSNGKFEYYENQKISFKVGGISLGETVAKSTVTPIDLVKNSNINTPKVRNIASFLQSLDSDGNASNGITITKAVSDVLASNSLKFNSENFLQELTKLIKKINEANKTSLKLVFPNDAATHLASNLEDNPKAKILPKLLKGRKWEKGEYYPYNTAKRDEYLLKVGDDLKGVRYHFGNNQGFYMDFEYKKDTLIGRGNYYSDLNSNTPTKASSFYEYRNRVSSPGFIINHKDTIFAGYYNFFKTKGELGELEGTYESFLYYDQKKTTSNKPEQLRFYNRTFIIEKIENSKNFKITHKSYDKDGKLIQDVSGEKEILKEDVDKENIVLVRFMNNDYLFFDFNTGEKSFQPGLIMIKK